MKILSNTTSPFARVARIALIEKGVSAEGLRMMNPWGPTTRWRGSTPPRACRRWSCPRACR